MKSFAINLAIACLWLLLSENPSPSSFAIGFLIGFGLLAAFRPILGEIHYTRRCLAFALFFLRFVEMFLVANAKVAWAVLFRSRDSLNPNFVTYDVSGMTRAEILILSYCITLTPGTSSVDITPEFDTLVVHALDAEKPQELRAEIDQKLRKGILGFTR